jgi:hypothetical protein
VVSQKFIEEQQQILRLTTPRLKSTPGAPFAQDDSNFCDAYYNGNFCAAHYDSNFVMRISDSGHYINFRESVMIVSFLVSHPFRNGF